MTDTQFCIGYFINWFDIVAMIESHLIYFCHIDTLQRHKQYNMQKCTAKLACEICYHSYGDGVMYLQLASL